MMPPCPAARTRHFSPSGWASLPIAAGLIMNGHRVGSPRTDVLALTRETSTITRGRNRTRRYTAEFSRLVRDESAAEA